MAAVLTQVIQALPILNADAAPDVSAADCINRLQRIASCCIFKQDTALGQSASSSEVLNSALDNPNAAPCAMARGASMEGIAARPF